MLITSRETSYKEFRMAVLFKIINKEELPQLCSVLLKTWQAARAERKELRLETQTE